MHITHDDADGSTLQSLREKGGYWTFAILADGAITSPYGSSEGIREDGSYDWQMTVELSAPPTKSMANPVLDGYVTVNDTQHMVFQNQAPYTKEQKEIVCSIDVK